MEWCWDWYDENYYRNSPQNNPIGASSGYGRVLRGGSWDLAARGVRSTIRYYDSPESVAIDPMSLAWVNGFRLARN